MTQEHLINPKDNDVNVDRLPQHVQMDRSESKNILKENRDRLNILQEKLYSEGKKGLLLVFQAMDAAGKDSTIRAVFSGMNPQGFLVSSFKQPSKKELAHDYLWRVSRQLPAKGRIGVFNRSHYEEVLVCRVHPEYVLGQNIPEIQSLSDVNEDFWTKRYRQINDFERHLSDNGYRIIKFFLNVSKKEQKKRFIDRMEESEKHWKFSLGDFQERQLWDQYMEVYSQALRHTSTEYAPWYAVPADDKDYLRASVSSIILQTMESMNLRYPESAEDVLNDIERAREILASEQD